MVVQHHGSAFCFLPCLVSPLVRQHPRTMWCTRTYYTYLLNVSSFNAAVHLLQAIRYRLWFMIPTMVVGGMGELIGWAGRYWGSQNPQSFKAFIMQITTTIFSYVRREHSLDRFY